MKRSIFGIWLLLWSLCVGTTAEAKVVLPSIFGKNMVLQQQADVKIWGRSDRPSVTVAVSWSDTPVQAEVKEGRWSLTLTTPAASFAKHRVTVSDEDSRIELRDILIGEVWICSGQSNMFMPLRGYTGQPVEGGLAAAMESTAYSDRIRMITVEKHDAETPQEDIVGKWTIPSPESSLKMSAVAYFFARYLTQALNVPVGIVSTSWGGSKIEAWSDSETLRAEGYNIEKINSDPKIEPRRQCCKLYNGMIAPIAGFTARGFVWYQGESNRKEAAKYARLMERMTAYWRQSWGDTEAKMPMLYVQICPHAYSDAMSTDASKLVEAQIDALSMIPNSALIPTTDLGEERTIHPRRKEPIGERLAATALRIAYGKKMPDTEAVRFQKAEFAAGKATVWFEGARAGLTPQECDLEGFELAGADGVFHPATGRIVTSKPVVEVTSSEVPHPVKVRYAYRNYLPGVLANTMGFAALPFRSDR